VFERKIMMYYAIEYMKAIACLLIANFHSDILFPDEFSILAFGGDIGNNIFFAISGFTLFQSIEKTEVSKFGGWYKKRFFRLLPILLLFYFLSIVLGTVNIAGFSSAFKAFIFPTIYWFTGAILVFYILYFWIIKMCPRYCIWGGMLLMIVIHLYFDNSFVERYCVGLSAMLVGGLIYQNFEKIRKRALELKMSAFLFAIVTGVIYVLLKLIYAKAPWHSSLIHLSIGIATVILASEMMILGCSYEKYVKAFSDKHKVIYRFIRVISQSTLAVYLLMGLDDRIIMWKIRGILPFPLSYVVDLLISIILAYAVTRLDSYVRTKIRRFQ
jgi:peptidoglycan/LPS O-acetylase OafA/YrhL